MIKKIGAWVVGALATIGALFVLIKTRDPNKMVIEFERIKLNSEIKQKEIAKEKAETEGEYVELNKRLDDLKKRKKDLAERLKKLTIGTLVLIFVFTWPISVWAEGKTYGQLKEAYEQLQRDYLEALTIAEELMRLVEELETLAEKYKMLYEKSNEELTKALEISNELLEWSNKLQQELLKSMKRRLSLSCGVLYHQNALGMWAGITIAF